MNFSDGTKCEFCREEVLTMLNLDYKEDGKTFCCKECADDYKEIVKRPIS